MQFIGAPQTLNSRNSTASHLWGKHHTTGSRYTIHQNITGSTFTCLATVLDAGITLALQQCKQRFVRSHVLTRNDPINTQFEFHLPSFLSPMTPCCASMQRSAPLPERDTPDPYHSHADNYYWSEYPRVVENHSYQPAMQTITSDYSVDASLE